MHVSPGIKIDNVECSLLSAVTDAAGVVPCYPRSFFKAPLTVSPIKSTWTKSKTTPAFRPGRCNSTKSSSSERNVLATWRQRRHGRVKTAWGWKRIRTRCKFQAMNTCCGQKTEAQRMDSIAHLLVRFVSYHILKIQYLPIISFRRKPSQNSSRVGRAAITCKTMLKTKCVRNPVASPLKSPGADQARAHQRPRKPTHVFWTQKKGMNNDIMKDDRSTLQNSSNMP